MKLTFELVERPIESYLVIMNDGQTIGSIGFSNRDELKEVLNYIRGISLERISSNTRTS